MSDSKLPADVAVLLIGHGGVDRVEDVAAFVKNIRHGRPPTQEIVDEVARRWLAIGGSPLNAISRETAEALRARVGVPVAVASRMWSPGVRDVVPALVASGVRRLVSVPLAPFSARIYGDFVRSECASLAVDVMAAAPWGTERALVDAFAITIEATRDALPIDRRDDAHLLLTAHSLPTRVIAAGDDYEREVGACARAVVAATRWSNDRAHVAYQSQGMDGGAWLGPDLPTTFASLGAHGVRDVVVCAIGFLADHTEVLYDLDVEARAIAQNHGVSYHRAPSLNAHARLVDALESVTRATLASSP
jgi:ferrochelatase